MITPHRRTQLLKQLGVAGCYALLGLVVLFCCATHGVISIIWLPSGLALAALLLGGNRYIPGVFLGAFLINSISNNSFGVAAALATGNTLEAYLGAWLLSRNNTITQSALSLRNYLQLIMAGGAASSVSALLGSTTLLLSGFLTNDTFLLNLVHWWMGDALGIILMTPLILVWRQAPADWLEQKQIAEAILLLGLTFLIGQVLFLDGMHDTLGSFAKGYWMFLFITWAAVRLGTHALVIILIMTAIQGLLGAQHGTGFFADDIIKTQLANYWFFMVILSVTGMALATYFVGRKQAEQALTSSETYHRTIFDATPDAVLISDMQGLITQVNHQAEYLLGYMANELIGQPLEILLPEHFRAAHPAQRAQFAAASAVRPMGAALTAKAQRKDGSELDVDISVNPIKTEQGLFFASALRDVTARMQAAAALQASEAYHRAIFDATPDAMLISDTQGIITQVNRQAEYLLGYMAIELLGQSIELLVPGRFRATHPAQHAQFVSSPITRPMGAGRVVRALRKDGSEFDVDISISPIKTEQGLFFASALRDVTERKQTETHLRVAAIAFESHEPMVITDTNTIILQVNQAFTESTGYSKEEAVGQKINLLKSGRHDADFYAAMWESIQRTGSWQGEIWDKRKNGELYPKWLIVTAVRGDEGEITHYVGTHIDITERKAIEEEIKQLAFYDTLTQLPNRRLLLERLKHSIDVERRDGKQLALLMLDLDRFKAVNDSLGHLAGDELLQQVAARITTRLRDVDMVARLGGDEFIVLLEDITHIEDAARVAKDIVTELTMPFQLSQSNHVQIGASIGISLYPQHGDNPETLMSNADAALYQAKDAGRGCFAYFSEDLTIAARERIELETRLRQAIDQQELRVFYQPQVDIVSGRIIGAEALVRWQDPTAGLILPMHFIPVAEETGLILAVGEWVLRETCRQGRRWLDAGLPPITLAVNVSPHQFRRGDINALVTTVLSETGFPARQLELEITESGLMENQDKATDILTNLRNQGIRLAIDDFGTGYSSLTYLKHFPLDVLKIDRSFIMDIPHHQDDMEIAATIIAMGHTLGLKVLAEGVETPEQLAFLRENGCDSYQGFIKSQPVPADAFAELLRDQLRG